MSADAGASKEAFVEDDRRAAGTIARPWLLATRAPRPRIGTALRRVPRAGWICALVAVLNAACWSIVTPPFQVPDEPSHFAYVKQLAETGRPPTSGSSALTPEEQAALSGLRTDQIILRPQIRSLATRAEQRALDADMAHAKTTHGSPAAGNALHEPPLYYAIESIPYELAASGTVLDRLALMRLMSCLFAGLTALFSFLFVREALPGTRWAWTVAGLAIALAPLLGFMSGAVNPDAMLAAVCAATFYLLARAFRRGLDARGALAIGAVAAIGLLTKLNYVGLMPGVLIGVLVLSTRAARIRGRSAYLLLALAGGVALSPALAYVAINAVSGHALLGILADPLDSAHGSLVAELNYVWQLYLPPLPGTVNDFPGLLTARQLWFDDYVGQYGWLDTSFPGWVQTGALVPAAAIAALCVRGLSARRAVLRRRAGEIAVYGAIGIGLLLLVGAASFRVFPSIDAEYAQIRYLLPLLALLGLALALAARGAGRRWGPAASVLIVALFLAHDVFSQLQVVARFYG